MKRLVFFRSSSVVEHSAVNRVVVGSNPTCGAIIIEKYPSGSRGAPAKGVDRLRGARVRIPSSLPYLRPVGQAVKTPPFHGGNTGSSPVRVTILSWRISSAGRAPALQAGGRRFEPVILHH